MKRLLCFLLCLVVLAITLCGCGDSNKPVKDPTDGTTEATTTEAPTTTEATTTEATTTTEETTTEATTTEPEPEPLVYVESLFDKIPVTKENHVDLQVTNEQLEEGSEAAAWDEDGEGVLVNGATLISFNLPKDVPVDTTVVAYIKGSSEDNFRLWLLDAGVVTSSNQINMQNDMKFFAFGEYEFFCELTCQYFDAEIADNVAKKLCFKAPSWDSTLTNLKIDKIAIFEGTLEEYREACLNPPADTPDEPAEEVTTAPVDNTEVESTTTEAQWSIEPANETRYATADLNVRATPEQDGERISHVDEGDEVTVTGWVDNGWARIKFRDGEYFVNGKYLSEDKPVVATAATTTEATTEATTAKPVNDTPKEPTKAQTQQIASKYMEKVKVEEFCPTDLQNAKSGVNGKLERKSYYSTTCKRDKNVIVLLPKGYTESKEYPVMYFLHGIWGDETTMVNHEGGRNINIIGNMIAEGLTKEMIVVFPSMYSSATQPACTAIDEANSKAYDNFLNDLTVDLMPWMEENYSIKTGRENTAVIGFSMGGREALAIGLTYPDKFAYVGAIAPAPGLIPGRDWAMEHYGQFKESELKYDGYAPFLTMICCGTRDGTVGSFPKGYHEVFDRNDTDHIWYEINGSDHGDPAIASGLYNFLKYVFNCKYNLK